MPKFNKLLAIKGQVRDPSVLKVIEKELVIMQALDSLIVTLGKLENEHSKSAPDLSEMYGERKLVVQGCYKVMYPEK